MAVLKNIIHRDLKHRNLKAYDNYEHFDDPIKLETYRHNKIDSASGHVSFIRNIFDGRSVSVLELGSGNSKTLYALQRASLLECGIGLEVSEDRHSFAERWKSDWTFNKVENHHIDFTTCDVSAYKKDELGFDLAFCVDLAFQFAEPIKAGNEKKLLYEIFNSLKEGGRIILELDACSDMINDAGEVRLWEEFPEPDPWRYSMWHCKYNSDSRFLEWNKKFIGRDMTKTSESSIIIRIYSVLQIHYLLSSIGFINIKTHKDWSGAKGLKYAFENGREFIITAEKPKQN